VPSAFLIELPRDELDFQQPKAAVPAMGQPSEYDDHASTDAHDGVDFSPDDLEFPPRGPAAAPAAAFPAGLTTAAELVARSESPTAVAVEAMPRISPEAFHQGMIVIHPSYGPGKIIALSGSGPKRKATVMFASGAGEKHFLLVHSPLRPASA
jgi:hypothetical protein